MIASCMQQGQISPDFTFTSISLKQHLANADRRAASKTRTERKIAAVREVAAMKGRSRARVTPSVSRGSASTQEERHSRRLRGRAVSGIPVTRVSNGMATEALLIIPVVTTMVSGAVVADVAEEV